MVMIPKMKDWIAQIWSKSFIMKILVTGGKGFIGSKIVEMLTPDTRLQWLITTSYGIMTQDELDNFINGVQGIALEMYKL